MRRGLKQALVGHLAIIMAGVIAGCGVFIGGPARPVSTATVCHSVPQLTQFIITRKSTAASVEREFSFPLATRVRNAQATQTVASAMCQLPVRQPDTVYHCPPAGPDIVYTIRFYRGRHPLPLITLPTWGCGNVTGLGKRPRFATEEFWGILGHAMHINNPGHGAFVGT